jgi:hypothetical protein
MKTKTFFTAMFVFGLFLFVIYLGAFLRSCSRGDEIYVYFGDAGYTQYTNTSNGDCMLLNTSNKSYYISAWTLYCTHHWLDELFCLGIDSTISNEVQVNPGDTVFIKRPTEITCRWKYIDECGHKIPFNFIEYVGYWEDGEFHRKE